MQQINFVSSLIYRTDVIKMSSEFTQNLVKQAREGSAEAFGELYAMYAKDMYRFAFFYTSSQTLAEDAVSDAVLAAFESVKKLKNPDAFKPWLFKILFNCCKQKQKEKHLSAQNRQLSVLENNAAQADVYSSAELRSVLAGLSDEEREIVILAFALKYTSEEIGQMLKIKAGTVRSKLSRAAAKLRASMADE